MSQRHDDTPPADERQPETNDRREFIRQSLGVAPLMLSLGGRGYGGRVDFGFPNSKVFVSKIIIIYLINA